MNKNRGHDSSPALEPGLACVFAISLENRVLDGGRKKKINFYLFRNKTTLVSLD